MSQPEIRVLYISYDGMTDPLGQSQVLPYLRGLSSLGFSISLLSCEKPAAFAKNKSIIESICAEAGIDWQPIAYHASPPVLSTIRDIRNLTRKALELHKERAFSIVHCRSYISAFVGLSMKRKFGTGFLFDMRGFWADERIDGGLWNLRNPLYRIIYHYFKQKEKEFLKAADHIISLTHAGREELLNRKDLSVQPLPVTVIPCCVDMDLFDPAVVEADKLRKLREELGIAPSLKVIGYVGSIGTWYLLDEMLLFYKRLQERKPETVLLFVSNEPPDEIVRAAGRLGLDASGIIVRSVGRKEVPEYIRLMSYGLFFIKPCFSKKASSPTKQGEIMAMGVPAICNAGVGDTELVVQKYRSGIAVQDFSQPEFDQAIDAMDRLSFDAADIRRGAQEFYGLDKGVQLYSSVYKQLSTI